jgi:hypothetical protein
LGKKTPPPKPPDLTPISDAQVKIAQETNDLAREQLGLSKEQFAWMQENSKEELALAREQADKLFQFQEKAFASDEEQKAYARKVGDTQIDAMNLQMDFAKKDRQRYEDVFLPMQDQYIAEANAYDTPERREAEASRQMVDIQRQADAQRNNADERLRSMGIDPSQVRSSSMMNQLAVATGANQALAGNAARTQIEDKGRAMRADAMNLGMGLPAQAASGFQGSNASGAGALGAGAAGQGATLGAIQAGAGVAGTAMGFRSNALNNVAALTGSPMQWAQMGSGNMAGAGGMYGQAAGTMSQNFNNQMSSWNAGQQQAQQNFSNIMSVASMAGGMMMAEGGYVGLFGGGLTGRDGMLPGEEGFVSDVPPGPAVGSNDANTWAQIKARWDAKRAKDDPYIRSGKGSGKGGALSFLDRMDNAAAAGKQYTPTNEFEDGYQANNVIPMPGQSGYAEGGRARFRGAIPTRQSRDNIPAWVTEGEYVVPRDVVNAKGIEFFDRLTKKYHRENS